MVWGFGGLGCLTKFCLWCFRKESDRLWRQVIATKYGVANGGWCTRGVRGTYGCGMWKSITAGAESFFGQVVYIAGEGHRIRIWHDPWRGHAPLKVFFQICLHVLCLKKLGFLTGLFLHQKGEVGVGIYNFVEFFMIENWGMYVLFLSFFILIC